MKKAKALKKRKWLKQIYLFKYLCIHRITRLKVSIKISNIRKSQARKVLLQPEISRFFKLIKLNFVERFQMGVTDLFLLISAFRISVTVVLWVVVGHGTILSCSMSNIFVINGYFPWLHENPALSSESKLFIPKEKPIFQFNRKIWAYRLWRKKNEPKP